jgi:cellulose synthase (UDP-forming)
MKRTTVFLPEVPTDIEKLKYTKINTALYKVLIFINLITWGLFFYNYYMFFTTNFVLLLVFGPLVTFTFLYQILSLFINLKLPQFDYNKHKHLVKIYWVKNLLFKPSIDVFLPVCGEDIDILRNTWEGVYHLKNKLYNLNPIVLDDYNSPEVQELANDFGFRYLTRPNRGEFKKAGNLKFGFENSNSEFILILDADFKPRPDFIIESLPYMADSKIGIIQTPQFFDNNQAANNYSPLMNGAAAIQEYFYKIIQPARGELGGAICVGTCAIYRRKALALIGGTYQIEHSEDVYTGFALNSKGYNLTYLPLILSKGVCPDDLHSFFKQQTRWCLGALTLMLNKEFWQVKIPFISKLCFISGFAYYISNFIGLILTTQTLITLYYFPDNYSKEFPIVSIILLINSILVQLIYVYEKPNFGTILAHGAASWSYIFTLLSLLLGHEEGWTPTGAKTKISQGLFATYHMLTGYTLLMLGGLLYVIYMNRINFSQIGVYNLILFYVAQCLYCLFLWWHLFRFLNSNHYNTVKMNISKFIFSFQRITLLLILISLVVVIADNVNNRHLTTVVARSVNNSYNLTSQLLDKITYKKSLLE